MLNKKSGESWRAGAVLSSCAFGIDGIALARSLGWRRPLIAGEIHSLAACLHNQVSEFPV